MSFKFSPAKPLSPKQKAVWSLIRKGLSVSAIAKKLNTTRQYINQTRLNAEAKLSKTLLDVAGTNDLQISKIYPKKGILVGYHPGLKLKAIITYTTTHGIKVWYWNEKPEKITNKNFLDQTRKYLFDIAKEQHIELDNTTEIHPAKLAHIIFSKLIPEENL
ncbi:MAG: hypothetical protein P8Y18_05960 [Candidatus Bathyarchaeota archaeon]